MSMDAIKNSAAAHKRALNNQEARQKLEVEMAKKNHDANLDELRKSKRQDAVNIENENHKQLAEKTFEKERKLEQIRMNLEETQRITDQELKRQEVQQKKIMADKNENFRNKIETTRTQQELSLDETNHRFNVASREANNIQKEHLYNQENRFRREDVDQKQQWNSKINQNRNQFAETFTVEDKKFEALKSKQETEFKKNLAKNHEKNETKLSQQNKEHIKLEEKLKAEKNKTLQDQEMMFEKKYNLQFGRHQEAEKNLEEKNKKIVEKSKEELVDRIKVYENRSNDPFFKFTHMKPTVTEEPDHYVLKIALPEYAKEEVVLSTNNREIVMTFNRRHKEERTDEDGSKLKVDKVESTVSRIPVESILDPKKISKDWADGVLTYKVFKA